MTRKRHLSQEHWQEIAAPDSVTSDAELMHDEFRHRILVLIMPTLKHIIMEELTQRQRLVCELYFFSGTCTQVQIAKLLGIRQPTVSQHLMGKIRNQTKIGGAIRRIRKSIRRRLKSSTPNSPEMSALSTFDGLLHHTLSRRSAHRALASIKS